MRPVGKLAIQELEQLLEERKKSPYLYCFIGPLQHEHEMKAREYHRGFNEGLAMAIKAWYEEGEEMLLAGVF